MRKKVVCTLLMMSITCIMLVGCGSQKEVGTRIAKAKTKANIKKEKVIQKKKDMSKYVTYKLPKGLVESNFGMGYGIRGLEGCIFKKRGAKLKQNKYTISSVEHQVSGSVMMLTKADYQMKGKKIVSFQTQENHCEEGSALKELKGCATSAVIQKCIFDSYTPATEIEAKKHGIKLKEKDLTCRYWIVVFAKENGRHAIALSLNADEYTKKQMIDFARTVRFTKAAFSKDTNEY